MTVGDLAASRHHAQEALNAAWLLADPARIARHLCSVSWIAFLQGQDEGAIAYALEALDIAAEVDDEYLLSICENTAGNALSRRASIGVCRSHHERALRHAEAARDEHLCCTAWLNLAVDELEADDCDLHKVIDYAYRAQAVADRLQDPYIAAYARGVAGHGLLLLGEREQAWEHVHDALARAHRLGAARLTAGCLIHAAALACADTPTVAAELLGHADALLARTGAAYEKAYRTLRDDVVTRCQTALPPELYNTHSQQGANATTRAIIETVNQMVPPEAPSRHVQPARHPASSDVGPLS